mmetsp:Transcript_102049/g.304527  ORF Transcript_102049/g.304527 Transcript_102049/m.304527 type:complete len:292 (-) Transcript_102049:46-921(-)
MANYSKWDKLEVSDDEEEKQTKERQQRLSAQAEEMEKYVEVRDEVERWLKRHLTRMRRELGADPSCPELHASGISPRFPSDEERRALAMFIAVVHHEKLKDNLSRHHDIMNIARQNRWIEEDPGTLELLCRLHRGLLQVNKDGERSISSDDQKMEDKLISAINILAAPPLAGCPDGYGKIFELFAMIGDPKSEKAWDVKAKYMKKEYAGDALFNSMMPSEARLSGGGNDKEDYDMPTPPWKGLLMSCFWIGILVVLIYLFMRTLSAMLYPAAVDATPGDAAPAPDPRAAEL